MMDYEEAQGWLRGERSTVNWIDDPVSVAQADAALTQQAYWVARAHRERLIGEAG